jgi:hypothetical protein
MKRLSRVVVLLLVIGLILGIAACPTDAGDDSGGGSINWEGQPNGTLTVINNSTYDMVVFIGQTPTSNGILGGVRAGTTINLDVSDDVPDFEIGGYMILRAMRLDEYEKNKSNLSLAKIDYSAMATYGAGKKYRAELRSINEGNFSYRVQNRSDYGVELRLNSKDGEKLAYLSPKQSRVVLYSPTNTPMVVWPVYVAYNTRSQSIVSFVPPDFIQASDIQPKASTGTIDDYSFPPEDADLDIVFDMVTLPFATITVRNNVGASRSASFRIGTSTHIPQSNYELVTSGSLETYEIPSTDAGQQLNLNCGLISNTVAVPVRFEGETGEPLIKNGYIYQVTLSYVSGPADQAGSYKALIEEVDEIDPADFLIAQ